MRARPPIQIGRITRPKSSRFGRLGHASAEIGWRDIAEFLGMARRFFSEKGVYTSYKFASRHAGSGALFQPQSSGDVIRVDVRVQPVCQLQAEPFNHAMLRKNAHLIASRNGGQRRPGKPGRPGLPGNSRRWLAAEQPRRWTERRRKKAGTGVPANTGNDVYQTCINSGKRIPRGSWCPGLPVPVLR